MSKYHNIKKVVDGHEFDSTAEANRYIELRLLERSGQIKGLKLQPEFVLQPAFRKGGKRYRQIVYKADFTYFDLVTGKNVVEDVKGCRTEIYRLKQKLFEYKYPDLTIVEVKA